MQTLFWFLMTAIALGTLIGIAYTVFTPSLEECLRQQATEDISSACWNILLEQGER